MSKKTLFMTILWALLAQFAFAKSPAKNTLNDSSVRVTQSAPTASLSSRTDSGSGSLLPLGVGVSSINQSLSVWKNVGSSGSLQGMFHVSGTSGGTGFGLGVAYRHNISEGQDSAFHLGGGLILGTIPRSTLTASSVFNLQTLAIIGFHFTVPGVKQVQFSFDGGPSFTLTDGNMDFKTQGFSSVLGASVHYFLN